MSKKPHYNRWINMMRRCSNPTFVDFPLYGARGIYVCEDWKQYSIFAKWCEITFEEGKTLDRIDNDGPYSPENCRWSTLSEQAKNRRPRNPKYLKRMQKAAQKERHIKFGNPKTRKNKFCGRCRKLLPIDSFYLYRRKPLCYCKVCLNNYQRKQYAYKNSIARLVIV